MRLKYRVANFLGYDLIKKKRNKPIRGTLERHVKAVLNYTGVDCVIDVGANTGQYGSLLRNEGYTGKIVSFEPVPSAFKKLKNISSNDDNWQAYNFALGKEDGNLSINISRASNLSSFLPSTDNAKGLFDSNAEIIDSIDVEVKRLDSIFDQVIMPSAKSRLFLKMDTQGYDLNVFFGIGQNYLKYIVGLQSELSVIPLYEGVPDYLEALGIYRKHGFEVTGFYPVFRLSDRQKDSSFIIGEMDCIMIRKD